MSSCRHGCCIACRVHFNCQKQEVNDGGKGSDLMAACKEFFTASAKQSKLALLLMVLPVRAARLLQRMLVAFVSHANKVLKVLMHVFAPKRAILTPPCSAWLRSGCPCHAAADGHGFKLEMKGTSSWAPLPSRTTGELALGLILCIVPVIALIRCTRVLWLGAEDGVGADSDVQHGGAPDGERSRAGHHDGAHHARPTGGLEVVGRRPR